MNRVWSRGYESKFTNPDYRYDGGHRPMQPSSTVRRHPMAATSSKTLGAITTIATDFGDGAIAATRLDTAQRLRAEDCVRDTTPPSANAAAT